MPERLTIQDIAHLAGVSKATVSRVLNQKPDVNPATRERISRIVNEQGFVPSITASGLAGGRPHMIGVLVPALTWPFIPEIVQGAAEIVEHSSYELVLYSTLREKDHSAMLGRILDIRLIAGLLAVTPGPFLPGLTQLYEQGFPLVVIDDQHLPTSAPRVGVDNQQGAYVAVRHLIDQGHRKIAHIKGPAHHRCSQERYQGYQQALAEAGINAPSAYIWQGDFLTPSGRAGARKLLNLPERPTAIFAANDHMAWGVLEAAEEYGLRVPEDVAVVGFDDMIPSAHKRPPLTSVIQPFHEIGQRAAELLLWLASTDHITASDWQAPRPAPYAPLASEPLHLQLPTSLVVRQSSSASHLASPPEKARSLASAS
jgi:LacI family transcriptional regulator